MTKRHVYAAILLGAVLVLAGCSSTTTPATEAKTDTDKKEAAAPSEPVLAKTAFWEMYRPAREWAKDVQVLTVASGDIDGYKIEGGKAPMWTAVFVSPSLMRARTYTYAIVDHLPEAHKGVTAAPDAPWSGATPKSKPFSTVEFQVNSDGAYDAAHQEAETYLKTHKDLPLSFFLASAGKSPNPMWYVLWGTQKQGYLAHVDAVTGKVIK